MKLRRLFIIQTLLACLHLVPVTCLDLPSDAFSKLNIIAPNLQELSSLEGPSEQEIELDRKASPNDYQALDLVHKSISGILTTRGYDSQVHYAITKDGYYIHLVRIINPLLNRRPPPKRPVVFNHGLIESGAIWVLSSRNVRPEDYTNQCLQSPIDLELAKNRTEFLNGPMLLANHGYDVWLMSMRGTDNSQYHSVLDPSSPKFWDYSLDRFALDDVPSVINYVRSHTNQPKVGYVGHSQATLSVFGLLATKPYYAQIIEPVFAVAPVAYMHHTTSLARPAFLDELKTPNLQGPVPEASRQIREKLWQYCGKDGPLAFKFICRLIDQFLGGKGEASLKGYLSFFPHKTSHKVLRHFGQLVSSGEFKMYDHGPEENLKRYGQKEAPLYKIGNIQSRALTLIWTRTDTLAEPADVERFKRELKVPLYRDIYIDRDFNHFDLITHEDARYLVFAPILEVLEEFEQRDGGFCSQDQQQSAETNSTGNKLQSTLKDYKHKLEQFGENTIEKFKI